VEILFWTTAIGFIASLTMAIFLTFIDKLNVANSQDFWIFGKLFFNKETQARTYGLACHIIAGIIFSFAYIYIWSHFSVHLIYYPILGLITGSVHGVAVGITQIAVLTNLEGGLRVGLIHASSHAVFGFTLGILVAILDYTDNFMSAFHSFINF